MNKHKYFVSYQFRNDGETHGFGNAIVKCGYMLEDMSDIRAMEDDIIKARIDGKDIKNVIIL